MCSRPTTRTAIEALDADCVFYAPLWSDPDEVCRLLRQGKNVVASGGAWWYRTEHNAADIDKIEAHASRVALHSTRVGLIPASRETCSF